MDLSPNYQSEDVMEAFNNWLRTQPSIEQSRIDSNAAEYVRMRNAFAAGMLAMEGSISAAMDEVKRDLAGENGTRPEGTTALEITWKTPNEGGDA